MYQGTIKRDSYWTRESEYIRCENGEGKKYGKTHQENHTAVPSKVYSFPKN